MAPPGEVHREKGESLESAMEDKEDGDDKSILTLFQIPTLELKVILNMRMWMKEKINSLIVPDSAWQSLTVIREQSPN